MFGEAARTLGNLLPRAISTDDGTFWLPRKGSDFAAEVDFNFGLVYWISVFFFALVTFLMVFFAVRYRQRPGHKTQASVGTIESTYLFVDVRERYGRTAN